MRYSLEVLNLVRIVVGKVNTLVDLGNGTQDLLNLFFWDLLVPELILLII